MATGTGRGDTALWQAAAVGDHDAFGQLFERHATAVYNYLFRRTSDWSMAEDLTAAVFLQAWRRRTDVTFDLDSARPRLLGVARLLLRNATRARMRAARVVRLRAAISRLPRQQGEAIELCVYSGLPGT